MTLIERERSLLLVVDVQQRFYPEDRDDVDRPALAAFVDRVAWVAGVATASGVPVVVTEEDPDSNGGTFERVRRRLHADAAILPKPVFAAPDNPAILEALKATGRETTVLVGLETDVCVAHSAISLLDRGYRVVAVSDALFSPGDAHAQGLDRMRAAGVELISAKGLFYDWTRTLSDARALVRGRDDLASPPGFSL